MEKTVTKNPESFTLKTFERIVKLTIVISKSIIFIDLPKFIFKNQYSSHKYNILFLYIFS